ncbi:2-amino-4-hydroxy-6-hydroxymethyldihydropteridine pyrophosphokinase [Hyphomicrobium nitrativorans NL23]|uniref:2-amino-4-hydroxy-6-hydroxymethyldihydropteridine pyrophosphokinase n=1 Tax=Hyphomicrobium nitrativorans NL23 TaxID=1029756 RepID=V5SGH4_9HYPH|nr:2-amino-4-hydroxy-6-hydroxymethyldihydropteridine diphosphokinase [Hyphomicrobium nitrativorans]AHB49140.1 2-amino-4-hydroxy-6-hydroxymethyldihydropteridine pyrophosphokinase [Hyphomicrobium nitrativorans NL23]
MKKSAKASADFDALIGLGSNMGDKQANIRRAIGLLTEAGDIRLVRASRLYRTPPWGVLDQDWFVNACIAVATDLAPYDLLARCLGVEDEMKRVRHERWGPRVIDVDVLTYRNVALDDARLTVPHPRIVERAFVLLPLKDIAPDLVVSGHVLDHWLAKLDTAGVEPVATAE